MASSGPGDDVTLDDLVARVRELPTRFTSLYVETDGWTDRARSHRASSHRDGVLGPLPPVDPDARPTRHHVRTWMVFDAEHWEHAFVGVTPTRCRVEMEFVDLHGETDVSVAGRDETAEWSGRGGEVQRHDPRGFGSIHSGWVVGRQWIGDWVGRELLMDDVEVLGRRCARVRVTPPPGHWAPGPLHSGDEHHLDVDPATGLTLALTSLFEGEPISHHEVLELETDLEVDAALTAPPDDAAPAPEPSNHRNEREVASVADGLVLLAPTWLPDGYSFGTGGAGAQVNGEMHAGLYYRCEGRPTAMVSQFPSEPLPDREVDGWTTVRRGERRVVVSDTSDAEGTRIAWTQVDGTRAMVRAELSADQILEIAFSLEPVRP